MSFKVTREIKQHNGIYRALSENGSEAGVMTYRVEQPDTIVIDHTKVNEDYTGKGIGQLLMNHAIETARKEKTKILPVCSYARHYFEKHAETLKDIRADEKT